MKTSYQSFSRFFIWCLFCALFVSCNKDPEYFTLVDYPDQMHIKSSVEDIVFNKGIANQEAVTFTWEAAVSPLQPSDEVTYKIGFYDTNQKETNHSEFIDLGNVTSVSFFSGPSDRVPFLFQPTTLCPMPLVSVYLCQAVVW